MAGGMRHSRIHHSFKNLSKHCKWTELEELWKIENAIAYFNLR